MPHKKSRTLTCTNYKIIGSSSSTIDVIATSGALPGSLLPSLPLLLSSPLLLMLDHLLLISSLPGLLFLV